jgi:preprotein translocase subunit SecD
MSNLKYRVLLIIALLAASAWSLYPRKVIERVKRGDRYVFDTVTRVPLKRGLDLQGGMHLALEIDESKGTVPDRSEALDRAIKVVRTRIDEFGVAEPVVQKSGDSQIIVELPGIDDRSARWPLCRRAPSSSSRSPTKRRRSKRSSRDSTRS